MRLQTRPSVPERSRAGWSARAWVLYLLILAISVGLLVLAFRLPTIG